MALWICVINRFLLSTSKMYCRVSLDLENHLFHKWNCNDRDCISFNIFYPLPNLGVYFFFRGKNAPRSSHPHAYVINTCHCIEQTDHQQLITKFNRNINYEYNSKWRYKHRSMTISNYTSNYIWYWLSSDKTTCVERCRQKYDWTAIR